VFVKNRQHQTGLSSSYVKSSISDAFLNIETKQLLSATLVYNGLVLHLPITYEESYAHFNLSLKSIAPAFTDNKVSHF